MSARGKRGIIKLARSIIASNSAAQVRRRLKGNLYERGKVVQRLQELVYQLRTAGAGRDWSRSAIDTTVHDLRKQAGDTRLSAAIRCRAAIALAVLEGFLPTSELDDSALSQYIRQIVAPKPEQKVETTKPVSALSAIEEALAKYRQQQEESC